MGAGGAAACREVEALGVQPDRAPRRTQGAMSRKPRQRGRAQRIHLRESRSSASTSAASPSREVRTSATVSGAARPKPPLKVHVLDPKPVEGEIGEAGIEASLRIAL